MISKEDLFFMERAISLAKTAAENDDVPVGALVVKNGIIIGEGYNKRELNKSSVSHAEIVAIEEACKTLGGWYLHDCTLYVTLEPCPMCAGAVINSRIDRVVFGAYDEKSGCLGSKTDFNKISFNHKFEVAGGAMEKECAELLKNFFRKKR